MPGKQRSLSIVLRVIGCLDTLALFAVVMPHTWMSTAAVSLGLDPLPADPIVGYLARSASAMYALHGVTVVFISFDVTHYRRLIRFLAIIAIVHGAIMLGIDIAEGLPHWWQLAEGPAFAATGIVVLWLQHDTVQKVT